MTAFTDTNLLIVAHMHRVNQLTDDPDARQEGYLKLAELAPRWQAERDTDFWTFAYLAVRQAVYRFLRREAGQPGDRLPDRAGPDTTQVVDVGDLLASLPGRLQPVARLHYCGHTEAEIAQRTGLHQMSVKRRIAQYRKRLEAKL
jgi:RNA polymerase sigma factor (sigma-70 family)